MVAYSSGTYVIISPPAVSLDQVTFKSTDGLEKYGGQTTTGSSSIRSSWEPMHKAGAAVREMLIKAGAQHWQVREADCYAEKARVYYKPTGKSPPYADLVEAASKLEVPTAPTLKDQKTLIGG